MNPGGMNFIMKQAQKLQEQMKKLQDQLAERTVEGSSGGGMVKVVANGKQSVLSVKIEKEIMESNDIDMLQDLVVSAVNDALRKSQEMVALEMGKMVPPGMNIPGLF